MAEWLAPEQNGETEQLYMEVFDEEPEAVRGLYPWLVRDNRIVVAKDAGAIVAMLQLVPRRCRLLDKELVLPYIFAVSTKPQYRGRGLMRELMENSLVRLASEHVPMAHLVPAVEHIYEKFGFAFIGDAPAEESAVVGLNQMSEESWKNLASPVSEAECETLAKKTFDWQDRHFALVKIEEASYYKKMDRIYRCYGGGVSVFVEQGEIAGYEFLSWDGERMHSEKQVRYNCQEPAALKDNLYNSKPFVMGRLVDIPAFLACMKPKKSFSADLKLSDPVLSQNNGYFRISARDGRFFWEKRAAENDAFGLIFLDVGALTAILCGYQRVLWLPEENCLNGVYLWDLF